MRSGASWMKIIRSQALLRDDSDHNAGFHACIKNREKHSSPAPNDMFGKLRRFSVFFALAFCRHQEESANLTYCRSAITIAYEREEYQADKIIDFILVKSKDRRFLSRSMILTLHATTMHADQAEVLNDRPTRPSKLSDGLLSLYIAMVPGKPHLHWSCFINRILGRPIEGSIGSHHNHNRYPFKHKAPSTTLLSTDTVVSSLHRNVPSALKSDHSSSSHLSTLSESSGESLPTLPSSPLSLTTSLSSSISNFTTSADNVDLLSSLVKTTTRTAPRLYPDAVDILVSASARAQKTKTACLAYLNDMPGPRLMDRHFDTEPVLTENIATKLRASLPRRHRVAQQWSLLYSLDQHGVSLSTLYRRLHTHKGPCLLVIKDEDDQVFGAFLNESLKPSTSYYGTGECFLWKQQDKDACHIYPWTGKNEYMILAEPDFIALGGGNGKFGLWIDSDLDRGYSEQCPTFDNDSLSQAPDFACMQLEIWGFSI